MLFFTLFEVNNLFEWASPMRPYAFTLVEAVVTLSVLLVITGIIIPSLGDAKSYANSTHLGVHQRNVGDALLFVYAHDRRDALPYYGVPGTAQTESFFALFGLWRGEEMRTSYWEQRNYWNMYLATQGYDGSLAAEYPDIAAPLAERSGVAVDLYTMTALAEPALFTDSTDRNDASLHHGQRLSDVRHTSAKGLLIRGSASDKDPSRWHVFFADGHVEYLNEARFTAPVSAGDFGFGGMPVVTTRDGILGRDVR